MKKILYNSVANAIGSSIPAAIGLPCLLYVISKLGFEEYGKYSLYIALISVAPLMDFGVSKVLIRSMAQDLSNKTKLKSAISFINKVILVVILFSTIIIALSWFFDISSAVFTWNLIFVVLCIWATLQSQIVTTIPESKSDFVTVNKIVLFNGAVSAIFPAATAYFYSDVGGLLFSITLARFIALYISSYLCEVEKIDLFYLDWDGNDSEIIKSSRWIGVSALTSPLMNYSDRYFLGIFTGSVATGIYTTSYDILSRTMLIPGSISRAMYPALNNGAGEWYKVTARINTIIAILIYTLLFLFGGLLLGDKVNSVSGYVPEDVFRILCIGCACNSIAQMPSTRLLALGYERIVGRVQILETVCYLILAITLIMEYGPMGAAYGWTIRVVADLLIMSWMSNKYAKV